MDYFGSKFEKSQSAEGTFPRPLASGGWGACPRSPFWINN